MNKQRLLASKLEMRVISFGTDTYQILLPIFHEDKAYVTVYIVVEEANARITLRIEETSSKQEWLNEPVNKEYLLTQMLYFLPRVADVIESVMGTRYELEGKITLEGKEYASLEDADRGKLFITNSQDIAHLYKITYSDQFGVFYWLRRLKDGKVMRKCISQIDKHLQKNIDFIK